MTDHAVSDSGYLLVVDDDPELRELIEAYLVRQGFDVATAQDGSEMDQRLAERTPDLVILDLMLPDENGLDIAKRLKGASEIPIIMISAQGEDVDRIVGLEVGADDYLGKPFNPRELLARVRAVLRRSARTSEVADTPVESGAPARYPFGDFVLDITSHRLLRGDVEISLTSGEFDLLAILVRFPNRVMDRDRILDLLTGAERSPFDRSIDVRVTRLRGKIEADPSKPRFIRTVWGKGYMFCPEADG
ncbi:MAG: response regulator [Pseudomonadaceae bacterium]|nr:response regulator [Pseudomonadaceae bacterium]